MLCGLGLRRLAFCDQPKLHTGKTRESSDLARRPRFGWAVFGATSERREIFNQVFHVKCSNPVNMTDVWTTEFMGVEEKMCSCETKKPSLIEAYKGEIIENSCEKIGNQWLVPYTSLGERCDRTTGQQKPRRVKIGGNRASSSAKSELRRSM